MEQKQIEEMQRQIDCLKNEGVDFEVVNIEGLSSEEIDEQIINNKILSQALWEIAK